MSESEEELNRIARAICDSESFMWLMVGANHPESHLEVLRGVWQEHYTKGGGGYGHRARGTGAWAKTFNTDGRAENDRLRSRVDTLETLLGYREAELLELKGPCSNKTCRLHYAHNGPCATTPYRSVIMD